MGGCWGGPREKVGGFFMRADVHKKELAMNVCALRKLKEAFLKVQWFGNKVTAKLLKNSNGP